MPDMEACRLDHAVWVEIGLAFIASESVVVYMGDSVGVLRTLNAYSCSSLLCSFSAMLKQLFNSGFSMRPVFSLSLASSRW